MSHGLMTGKGNNSYILLLTIMYYLYYM